MTSLPRPRETIFVFWNRVGTILRVQYTKHMHITQYLQAGERANISWRWVLQADSLKLPLSLTTGEVIHLVCSCVAGKTGYCNYSVALMLKVSKHSLFQCKSTMDLRTKMMKTQTWLAHQDYKDGTTERGGDNCGSASNGHYCKKKIETEQESKYGVKSLYMRLSTLTSLKQKGALPFCFS